MGASREQELQVLTRMPYEWQSGLILAALEREGIRATSSGGLTCDFRTESPAWIKILVFESDLPHARDALQRIREGDQEVDWSEIDVGRPAD
ncbi:MAG: hypothetical protein KDA75_14230 [Planctomycetaceae bacterium]|nr:hypothetical protein [Planctomycetaceae bacterium]